MIRRRRQVSIGFVGMGGVGMDATGGATDGGQEADSVIVSIGRLISWTFLWVASLDGLTPRRVRAVLAVFNE